jgi:hypothetical protein
MNCREKEKKVEYEIFLNKKTMIKKYNEDFSELFVTPEIPAYLA